MRSTSEKSLTRGTTLKTLKIKSQNHISRENSTTNFNTQENNEITVAGNPIADNSTNNKIINTRATEQQQTSINQTSHNEQPKTSNSAQSVNLNSFWFDRFAYSSSLNDHQNGVTGMGDTQTFNQPIEQSQQLSTTFPQPVLFYTPYLEALLKIDLQKFNSDRSKWADWFSCFSTMIGESHLSDRQKMTHLQKLVIEKA